MGEGKSSSNKVLLWFSGTMKNLDNTWLELRDSRDVVDSDTVFTVSTRNNHLFNFSTLVNSFLRKSKVQRH